MKNNTLTLEALEKIVTDTLNDNKAKEITSLDVRELTSITDKMVICTGTSKRHVQTITEYVVTNVKHAGMQPLNIEGKETGEWALIDLGDLVVHVMLPDLRELYSLEKLWSTTQAIRKSHEH